MFIENFQKFIKYYGKRRKTKLFGFFLLSLIAGLFEFLGIALVYPVILLLMSPNSVINSKYYIDFSMFINCDDTLTNALILSVIVVLIFIAKNLFMIATLYLQNKFINNWKLTINRIFMSYYLFAPYKNSLKNSPADKIYNLTFLTSSTLDNFILRGITLFTNIAIVSIILALLFIKFPVAAVITTIFGLVSMTFQSKFFKKRSTEIAKQLYKISTFANSKTVEGISNLKELKILSAEDSYYGEYVKTQQELNEVLFKNNFYSTIPPYITEIFVVISLLVMAGIISIQNPNPSDLVASYAVIIAAIFRIAPSLNRIQTSINAMNNSRGFVKAMLAEYESCDFSSMEEKCKLKIEFKDKLKLNNVNFSYDRKITIKDLNIEIKKGEFVGIVGSSGAGKSTLADVIMGLLPVDSGELYVDDTQLTKDNFKALRALIGYVPQQISILDGSFRKNVSWGEEYEDDIDDEKVINALKMAKLYDFVKEHEQGINAEVIVGSNGLSQGQKQRLAIARALYREPEILMFDEATSALDVETEHEITQMLNSLKGEKTIIAIAHRLSTLKSCDRLIYLKNGSLVDSGTFEELAQRHEDFDNLVRLSNINNG